MGFFRVILVLGILIPSFFTAGPAWAFDDAFPFGKKIVSRNFTITLALDIDEAALVNRLNIDPQHRMLVGDSARGINYSPDNLGDLLDALFDWVRRVLDMPINAYTGDIKVVAGIGQLEAVCQKIYGRGCRSEKAFYVFEKNTIYVVAPDFTKEIVGHEMGHAIICNFLRDRLSDRIQEVLARYIEYQLRMISPAAKSTK